MSEPGAHGELGLIVAMSRGGVIGRDGRLPWRLGSDLAHFKQTTLGHCVLMGRKTWCSLPGPLPGRTSIVITRNAAFEPTGAERAPNLDAAIALAGALGDPAPIVAGGAEIYALALPRATQMWITRVEADVDGDTLFPRWNEEEWRCAEVAKHDADARNEFAFSIERWVRRAPAS